MKTMKYINELRAIIREKTDRCNAMERIANEMRSSRKNLTKRQLEKNVAEVRSMEKEIEKHRAYCAKAQREIDAFFAPAMKEIAA